LEGKSLSCIHAQKIGGVYIHPKLILGIATIVIEGTLAAMRLLTERNLKRERRLRHGRNKSGQGGGIGLIILLAILHITLNPIPGPLKPENRMPLKPIQSMQDFGRHLIVFTSHAREPPEHPQPRTEPKTIPRNGFLNALAGKAKIAQIRS
jgi:hypothetical protein